MTEQTQVESDEMPEQGQAQSRHHSWLTKLQEIVNKHAHVTANGSRVASSGTKDTRIARLKRAFRDLREIGFPLDSPAHLKPHHVQALVKHWEKKGLSAATIQNRVSILRTFAEWIGKKGMIKDTASYASSPERVQVQTSATEPKTWSDNGIDINSKLAEITAYDRNVGMQVKLALVFGLRRRETVMLKPHRADRGDHLVVSDGTKGGRDRVVSIDSILKRETLDEAKELVGPNLNAHLGGKKAKSLSSALRRYDYVLDRCGVTHDKLGVSGHGLRHEYMNNRYEELAGVPSPIRGGARPEKMVEQRARGIVAEEAGHTRTTITSAYYGTHRNLDRIEKQQRVNQQGEDRICTPPPS